MTDEPTENQSPPDADDELLRRLVQTYQGNLTAIAGALGISRQAATRRIQAIGLARDAAMLRADGGVTGPRAVPSKAIARRKRSEMLQALAAHDSDEAARAALGMSRRTFYRRKAELNITPEAVKRARRRAV